VEEKTRHAELRYREEDWLRVIDALERIAASDVPAKRDPNVFVPLQGRYESHVMLVAHGETEEIPMLRRFLAAFGASRANAGWSQREVETIAADAVAATSRASTPSAGTGTRCCAGPTARCASASRRTSSGRSRTSRPSATIPISWPSSPGADAG
jgi:hypothetical protein